MNLKLSQITSKLSTRGWITVGVAAMVGVIFVYALMTLASSPSYTTLVAGVSPAQTGKITSALSTAGIPYELQNNGTAVAVESDKEAQARVTLDQGGLLNGTGSNSSFESLLGTTSLGESNFQQEQQNTSALEQQLQQTIESMDGIDSAQVELAIPDQADSLFSGLNTQPSASVLLNTSGSIGSGVRAIAGTVAGAVPGLSEKRVTITDQNGDLLWPTSGGSSNSLIAKQSAQEAYDTQWSERADAALVSALGPGKAIVQVNATLNTNRERVDSVTYGGKVVPLTANTTNEQLTGSSAATNQTAGNTATQLATYAGKKGSAGSTYSNKTSNITNGVDKTVSSSSITPGGMQRQSISVLVSKTVPASQLPTIKAAVENTVGYVAGRDQISVGSLAFAKPTAVPPSSSMTKELGDVKYVAIGLGGLVFLMLMTRMLRRRETEEFAGNPTWLRELETPRPLAALEAEHGMIDLDSPTAVARLKSPTNLARKQVEELVDRDPERVASQVRQWMTED